MFLSHFLFQMEHLKTVVCFLYTYFYPVCPSRQTIASNRNNLFNQKVIVLSCLILLFRIFHEALREIPVSTIDFYDFAAVQLFRPPREINSLWPLKSSILRDYFVPEKVWNKYKISLQLYNFVINTMPRRLDMVAIHILLNISRSKRNQAMK